jgi:hypothetical protein
MTPQEYILSTLKDLSQPIHYEDVGTTKIHDALYAKIMSKKFRKLKAGEKAIKLTTEAIEIAVKNNQPIRILEMFGGNKLWRFEEAPEIDWAELFSLTYFAQWARHIASVWKPGVIFEYFSQDMSVESLNNIPRAETDKYSQSFRSMLKYVKQFLPENIQFKYTRHYELFEDPNDYYKEIEESKAQILKNNNGSLPTMTDAMKAATELNVRLKPGQDTDPQWREKVELQHQAIFITPTLVKYTSAPNIVWTCPTYYEDSVVTGSTKRSIAKFWAAVGVLQPDGEKFSELTLTPKQLQSAVFNWDTVTINGLEGKNFKRVRVLKESV